MKEILRGPSILVMGIFSCFPRRNLTALARSLVLALIIFFVFYGFDQVLQRKKVGIFFVRYISVYFLNQRFKEIDIEKTTTVFIPINDEI